MIDAYTALTGAFGAMVTVIRSAVTGRPVPDVFIRNLSALMDVPEDLIDIGPVPGRGAGVRRWSAAPDHRHARPAQRPRDGLGAADRPAGDARGCAHQRPHRPSRRRPHRAEKETAP
ncbi:hypothetical protein Mame01_28880 [Microbispora amethystogenes]|nr:hypothetical protein Mame01_28880 [Microbispora amethystogenes]